MAYICQFCHYHVLIITCRDDQTQQAPNVAKDDFDRDEQIRPSIQKPDGREALSVSPEGSYTGEAGTKVPCQIRRPSQPSKEPKSKTLSTLADSASSTSRSPALANRGPPRSLSASTPALYLSLAFDWLPTKTRRGRRKPPPKTRTL